MPDWFRLTPINPKHESWARSTEGPQVVEVLANDAAHARVRTRAATQTDTSRICVPEDPAQRYSKIVPQRTPWELDAVTLCEKVEPPPKATPGDRIILADGRWLGVDWLP